MDSTAKRWAGFQSSSVTVTDSPYLPFRSTHRIWDSAVSALPPHWTALDSDVKVTPTARRLNICISIGEVSGRPVPERSPRRNLTNLPPAAVSHTPTHCLYPVYVVHTTAPPPVSATRKPFYVAILCPRARASHLTVQIGAERGGPVAGLLQRACKGRHRSCAAQASADHCHRGRQALPPGRRLAGVHHGGRGPGSRDGAVQLLGLPLCCLLACACTS